MSDRLAAARAGLALLEREGGAAALDGTGFDPGRLTAAAAEIALLEAAEAEARNRARADAERLAEAERRKARAAAGRALKRYAAALDRAEAAAKALVGDLRALQEEAAAIRAAAQAMGVGVPLPLLASEQTNTVSRLLAGELAGLSGRAHFGVLTFPSVPRPDWSAHFTRYVEPMLAGASEKEQHDGEPG